MLPEYALERHVAERPFVAFLRVLEQHLGCTFPSKGLDNPFYCAVGAGRLGSGVDVLEAKDFLGLG